MKTLTIWNPLKEMDTIHNRLSDAFFRTPVSNGDNGDAIWSPVADVLEDEKEYHIVLELPGLNKDDIEVKLDGEWLHITGERKSPEESENRTYNRIERVYGRFARRFAMPKDANAAQITAEFRDGLLQVTLAKKEEAQPKLIDVKIG